MSSKDYNKQKVLRPELDEGGRAPHGWRARDISTKI
jgi:hypothetical protein